MTPQERQRLLNLADTIKGEINRMCVTDLLSELDTMAFHAQKNLEKLRSIRYADLSGRKEE
jgi:hypothetical protein